MPHPVEGLNSQLLAHQRYRFYCGRSHHLFGKQNLPLQALGREPFVSFTSAQLSGALAEIAVFRASAAMTGDVVVTSSSLEEIQRFVRAGWGIGCLPEHTVQADVDKGNLWPLPPMTACRISTFTWSGTKILASPRPNGCSSITCTAPWHRLGWNSGCLEVALVEGILVDPSCCLL